MISTLPRMPSSPRRGGAWRRYGAMALRGERRTCSQARGGGVDQRGLVEERVDAEGQARRAGEQDPGLAQYPRLTIRQPEIADPDIAPPPRIPQRPRHRKEFRVGPGRDRDPGRCRQGPGGGLDLARLRENLPTFDFPRGGLGSTTFENRLDLDARAGAPWSTKTKSGELWGARQFWGWFYGLAPPRSSRIARVAVEITSVNLVSPPQNKKKLPAVNPFRPFAVAMLSSVAIKVSSPPLLESASK